MRWKLVIASVGLICLVIALALWGGNSSKRTLPDGTTLVLSGVMIGPTNIYMHGTFWSKIIGRFVPAKGFAVAGFKLQRPEKITFTGQEGSEILSARLELLPRSPREKSLVSPPFFRTTLPSKWARVSTYRKAQARLRQPQRLKQMFSR